MIFHEFHHVLPRFMYVSACFMYVSACFMYVLPHFMYVSACFMHGVFLMFHTLLKVTHLHLEARELGGQSWRCNKLHKRQPATFAPRLHFDFTQSTSRVCRNFSLTKASWRLNQPSWQNMLVKMKIFPK